MSFDAYAINPKCLRYLTSQDIVQPTPVQAEVLPPALEGRDVVAVAQTGTGKTLAFALPALTRLAAEKRSGHQLLVLTPTRELAVQVHRVMDPMAQTLKLSSVCLYGGVAMGPQERMLRRGCAIVIATPGRLMDHMDRGSARFDNLSMLVLDEADRMLDMGFLPDVKRIASALPEERQTMMFSATFAKEIAELAQQFLTDPQHIEVGNTAVPVDAVAQRLYAARTDDKFTLLSQILNEGEVGPTIVFTRTQIRTDRVAKRLEDAGFAAEAIHGGRSQAQRQRTLDGFRRGKFNILVATDVAARGIDVQGVTHVFNFDMPRCYDDYVHRIGRTARASAGGDAISICSPQEMPELRMIEAGLGAPIPRFDWEEAVRLPDADRPKRPAAARPRAPQAGGSRFAPRPDRGRAQAAGYRPRRHMEDQPERGQAPERKRPAQGPRRESAPRFEEEPRRESRPARSAEGPRAERFERPRRTERPERTGRVDRPDRTERPERAERVSRVARPERTERPERATRVVRGERPERPERPERSERREPRLARETAAPRKPRPEYRERTPRADDRPARKPRGEYRDQEARPQGTERKRAPQGPRRESANRFEEQPRREARPGRFAQGPRAERSERGERAERGERREPRFTRDSDAPRKPRSEFRADAPRTRDSRPGKPASAAARPRPSGGKAPRGPQARTRNAAARPGFKKPARRTRPE